MTGRKKSAQNRRRKKLISMIASLAVIAFVITAVRYPGVLPESAADMLGIPASQKAVGQAESARIVRVVDGDTVIVSLDGKDTRVRMIGVNTPESVHPDESKNTAAGYDASQFTKDYLPEGTEVWLEYDEDKTDQYGRTLAYVWLEKDFEKATFKDFKKYNYGAVLLQNTFCEAKYYAPNGKYRDWYEKLEKEYQ